MTPKWRGTYSPSIGEAVDSAFFGVAQGGVPADVCGSLTPIPRPIDITDWKMAYRRALASMFALGEVISQMRSESQMSDAQIDALIDTATAKWHGKLDKENDCV